MEVACPGPCSRFHFSNTLESPFQVLSMFCELFSNLAAFPSPGWPCPFQPHSFLIPLSSKEFHSLPPQNFHTGFLICLDPTSLPPEVHSAMATHQFNDIQEFNIAVVLYALHSLISLFHLLGSSVYLLISWLILFSVSLLECKLQKNRVLCGFCILLSSQYRPAQVLLSQYLNKTGDTQ